MPQFSNKTLRRNGFREWIPQHRNNISVVATLVSLYLIFRSKPEYIEFSHARLIHSRRKTYDKARSLIAIVNTPKMGGVGLSKSFIDSWICKKEMGYPSYLTFGCEDERMVVRAHDVDAGATAVQQHREKYPDGQCLIVTAIRSPATWFPSLYFQKSQVCEATSMSKEAMLKDYRRFLGDVNMIGQLIESCLPGLLAEFQGESLKFQAKMMDYTGGYSILGPAPSESVFAGCELLFLRMEQNDQWPGFIKMFVPDSIFYRGETHMSLCPDLSDHIRMIQHYQLTLDEKITIYTDGGEIITDWFDAYRYMEVEDSSQIEPRSYSAPGAIIGVINTPKTGTTGLVQTFKASWKCEKAAEGTDQFYITYRCPDDRLVLRSHQLSIGAQMVRQHRQEHPYGQCLIVTAIRHPETWLPSLYAQREKICESTTMTKDEMLQDYKRFFNNEHSILNSVESALGELMNEFTFGSLKEQSKVMNQNGGYSILSPASPESIFAGCELLFLRLEQSEQWPNIIKMMIPENEFHVGKSTKDRCSERADYIEMLQEYELTMEERMRIYNYGGGLMADWFDAYEYTKGAEEEIR